jgi:hypothetical protein
MNYFDSIKIYNLQILVKKKTKSIYFLSLSLFSSSFLLKHKMKFMLIIKKNKLININILTIRLIFELFLKLFSYIYLFLNVYARILFFYFFSYFITILIWIYYSVTITKIVVEFKIFVHVLLIWCSQVIAYVFYIYLVNY